MNLKGKTALITGASGGIGSALAKKLELEGVKLILVERDLSLFERLDDLLDGPDCTKFECDFSKPKQAQRLGKKISEDFNKIDLLFNVAGIGIYKPVEELSLEDWENSMNINVTAPLILVQELMPLLKRSTDPLVVNIGSGTGTKAYAKRAAYCSSKFALRGLSLVLSKEYKDSKVNFLLMTLGSVMTDFGPGGLKRRKELQKKGKKYLTVDQVVEKIMKAITDAKRPDEIVFYPAGYKTE